MTNADKFVELVVDLYSLGEKEASKLSNTLPEIDHELKKYRWEDIRAKVQLFFSRKNDKSRPRLSQILALLETDPKVEQIEPEPQYTDTGYKKPTTKIWSINNTFEKLVNVLIDCGIIPDESGNCQPSKKSLVDPITNELVLNPRQWLNWKLNDATEERPDLFATFPYATWLERLAIAINNKLVVFKLRDWQKLAQGVNQ